MTIRSRLAGSGAATTSHSVTLPAGVQVGDRLIVGVTNDSTATVSASGWTQVGTTQAQGANHSFSAWTRVATGSDSLSVGLSSSLAAEWVAICLQGDGGTPQFAFTNGATATTGAVTAITGLSSDDYDSLIFLGLDNSTATAHTVTPPSGWGTLTHDFTSGDAIGCWSMDQSSTAVTGFSPADVTWTNTEQWITAQIVVAQPHAPGSGITVRSAAGASGVGNGASADVTKPAGLAIGDLLLAFQVCDNDGTLAAMTGPSGWSTIASQAPAVGAQPGLKVWQQVATSTETAASTFSFSAGAGIQCSAGILAITAGTFDPTTPVFASPAFTINASSSTSHVAPSIATGLVNGLLVTAHSTDQGGAATCTYTPPSGMTEKVDTAAASGFTCVEVNVLTLASAAATGTKTATCTQSRPATSTALILAPAPATGGLAVLTGGFLGLLAA